MKHFIPIIFAALCIVSCDKGDKGGMSMTMSLSSRTGYSVTKLESGSGEFSYVTPAIKLEYAGATQEEVPHFTVTFPSDHRKYRAACLTYTMCSWNEGPADWDMTTIISIKNKKDGQWYEFTRAFTPYGGAFDKNWSKSYYMDISDFLPMMVGDTEFSVYYCGWDATDKRAHAVKLGFDFYEGQADKNVIFTSKIYDSCENSTPGYRRCWPYGFDVYEGVSYNIEDAGRCGPRTIKIPAGVKSAVVRVDITGHGMDYEGKFNDRAGYQVNGAAEFDYQDYTVVFNGTALAQKGHVFEKNGNNYTQAGTYYYDRAGWGPGKPANVHYWEIKNIPDEGATINLDIDFERYTAGKTMTPNSDGNAYYIVEADIFGYDK